MKDVIKWVVDNPEKAAALGGMAGGVLYTLGDLVIRIVIKTETVEAVEAKWGKFGAAVGATYRALLSIYTKSR
jgi:hypothetical protein